LEFKDKVKGKPNRFIIATTQLSKGKNWLLPIAETYVLLCTIDEILQNEQEDMPIIFGGDLNEGPDGNVYQFLTSKKLSQEISPIFSHKFNFKSAYNVVLGSEPSYKRDDEKKERPVTEFIFYTENNLICSKVLKLSDKDYVFPNSEY